MNPNSFALLHHFLETLPIQGASVVCPNSLLTVNATGTLAENKSFQSVDKASSVIVFGEPDNEAEILELAFT